MTFGSLFRGVGGFDLALRRAGMESAFAAECDMKCNSVCKRHWPDERTVTDVADVRGRSFRCNVLCAGWPCQGNSVAGKRAGLADVRSGLWSQVARILGEQRPEWFFGENVPGLLSVNGGVDLGAILGDLAQLGYGFAYRVFDAQWFGVPQRRRRVLIVGHLGDWRRAAEILFESEGLPWDSPPSRETRSNIAASLTRGADSGGKGGYAGRRREDDFNLVAGTLQATDGGMGVDRVGELVPHVAHALTGEGHDASEDGTGRGTPLVVNSLTCHHGRNDASDAMIPVAYQCQGSNVGEMGTLRAGNGNETGGVPFVLRDERGRCGDGLTSDQAFPLHCAKGQSEQQIAFTGMAVRRLMPIECERLMGLPDDWTRWGADDQEMADSVRYRMCGNSVAVPNIEWIARRIAA